MRHTLEHLYHPAVALGEIRRILKDDGILWIEVPNTDSLGKIIFRSHWVGWDTSPHLYHFTPKTLSTLLERNGFRMEKMEFPFYISYTLDSSLGKLIIAPFLKRLARTEWNKSPRALRPLQQRISRWWIDPFWLISLPFSAIGALFKKSDSMSFLLRKNLARGRICRRHLKISLFFSLEVI